MMRRKAPAKTVKIVSPSEKSFVGAGNCDFPALRSRKTFMSPAGKGLGKAGARRLGQLLKRAFPVQQPARGPHRHKTPFRHFKHLIRNTRVTGAQASVPRGASPHITQLILGLVSQCKHKGGDVHGRAQAHSDRRRIRRQQQACDGGGQTTAQQRQPGAESGAEATQTQ